MLVYGARGWLGRQYVTALHAAGHPVTAGTADIRLLDAIRADLDRVQPDVVLNAAAMTSSTAIPNIDACLASPAAQGYTYAVNAIGAGNVARVCAERGVRLVHLSSGCIFNGDQVCTETDTPNPPNWYAYTKYVGEQLVQQALPSALILRLRMPISGTPHPRNLITKLVGYRQVVDVVNSVTVVEDLLTWTQDLLTEQATGVVHAVYPEPVAFRDLLAWYRDIVDPAFPDPQWIQPSELRTVDGRSNCVLHTRLQPRQSTEQAIQGALRAYAQHLAGVA